MKNCPVCNKVPVFFVSDTICSNCCDFGREFKTDNIDVEKCWDQYVTDYIQRGLNCDVCGRAHDTIENKELCHLLHASNPEYSVGDWIRFKTTLGVTDIYYNGIIEDISIENERFQTNAGYLSAPSFVYKVRTDFNNVSTIPESKNIFNRIELLSSYNEIKKEVDEISGEIQKKTGLETRSMIYPNGKTFIEIQFNKRKDE